MKRKMVPTVYFDLLLTSLWTFMKRKMVPTVYFDLLLTSLLFICQRRGQDHRGNYGNHQGRHMAHGGIRNRNILHRQVRDRSSLHTAAMGRPQEKRRHQPQQSPPSSSYRSSHSDGQDHSIHNG